MTKTKPKLTFGRVEDDWGGKACAVLVDGAHEITLEKAEDGGEWYTRGTVPSDDRKPSAWFTDIDPIDGVDLGRTLQAAKAALRRYHFAQEAA